MLRKAAVCSPSPISVHIGGGKDGENWGFVVTGKVSCNFKNYMQGAPG